MITVATTSTRPGRAGPGTTPQQRPLWQRIVLHRWCYLFLVPTLILAGLFTFYPMVMSWVFSTLDWTGFTDSGRFIGLDNYVELVGDPLFWNAFGRSLIFMLVGAPIRVVLALLVAIALNNQMLKVSPVIRTFFFLPVVTTAAVVGIVMTFVLGSYQGPVNTVLQQLMIIDQPVEFLSNPDTALWAVLGTQVWKNFGMTMIYWLAALQTVPRDYYEAASVDGAGRWAQLRAITVPLLIPFAVVILILTAKEHLHSFALVQAMTAGGPYYSTQVVEVFIYQTAFDPETTGGIPRLGYASAAGCFFGLATLIFTLLQLAAVKKVNDVRKQLGTEGRAP